MSTLEKLSGLSRKLSIQVPAENVRDAFEKVYKGIQKNATIKGFRPGHAPLATIRTMYRDRVKDDVLQDLISDSYQKALNEHSLEPVGQPRLRIEQFDEENQFNYTAELEIRPDIQIRKFEGLSVKKEIRETTEVHIQEALDRLLDSSAELVPIFEDRGAQPGDVATLDFHAEMNGQPLENAHAHDYDLEIGAGRSIPDFENGAIGMKVGEHRHVDVTFPTDYHAKEIAGQKALFHLTMKALKKKSKAELNDEFAKKAGPFQNVAELKDGIRKELTADNERQSQEELRNSVLRALMTENPVQLPVSMVARQKELIEADVRERMKRQGMTSESDFDEYKAKWNDDFEQSAQFMVHTSLLIDKLAEDLKMWANEDEYKQRIQEFSKSTGIELARMNEFYSTPERKSRLMFQITEEKVVQYLLSKAVISTT